MFKTYYQLTKPGIIYGNAITASAGFFLASKGDINLLLFAETVLGISLVIASSCVLNNFIDRDIDSMMDRTKNRALVKGSISSRSAIAYSMFLGVAGFLVLSFFANLLTALVALTGFIFYVGIYTPLKRRTIYSTLVGSLAGAVPPVVGYCAVTNRFDVGALLLFIILVLWQMPHFYSIAIFRLKDYKEASLPVLPVVKGNYITKIHMLFYISAFIVVTSMLTILGYTGYIYLFAVALTSFLWLGLCIKGFKKGNEDYIWARKMFRLSLLVIVTLSITISLDVL